jgi:hypothetical protein
MNLCRKTVKMGVPPGNRPAVPRDWPEPYLDGTSQGEPVLPVPSVVAGSEAEGTPEDARKDRHIRGRSSRFMNNPG